MDGASLSVQFPVTPRLRVPRQTYLSTPLSATRSAALDGDTDEADDRTDDDEDNASTPRIASLNVAPDDLDVVRSESATPVVENNPASRLRALLARVPRDDTPLASAQGRRSPSMHASDMDMDIDTPQFSPPYKSTPPSNASASLKDLFSRALREPGDSPTKPQRRRRSSLDSSGIEESPVISRTRAKRMSLSDDEKEKANRSTDAGATSEHSFISSQAATFEALRQRLSGPNLGSSKSDTFNATTDGSSHVVSRDDPVPNHSKSSSVAISMPLRQSISQFPSQLSGTNLLNDDSDMQRFIKGVDNDVPTDDEHDLGGNTKTPHAGPSKHLPRTQSPFVRERTLSRHGSSESARHNYSRPSSSLSTTSHSDADPQKDRIHDLERGWNRPLSAYMNRLDFSANDLSPGHSPPALRRHRSSASLSSSDGLAHSNGSQGSDNHYHRHLSQTNRLSQGSVSSTHSRSSSISPVQIRVSDRSRTLSQPSPPNGLHARPRAESRITGERPSSSLAHSRHSFSSHNHRVPDRAVSPTSSIASQESVQEKNWDVQHVRERNWNSPHPKWSLSEEQAKLTRRRSQVVSPVPSPSRSRHDSLNQNTRQSVAKPPSPSDGRVSRTALSANNLSPPVLKRSPSTSSLTGQKSGIPRARPHSSLSLSQPSHRSETTKTSPSHAVHSHLNHRRVPSSPSPVVGSKGVNGTHVPARVKEKSLARNNAKRDEVIGKEEEREDEHSDDTPPKISISIEPVEMHDSDFSFHEEDILASSSRPRLSTGGGERPQAEHDISDGESLPPFNGELDIPDDTQGQILPENFSPPPSPPITPSDQIMSTPKRRSSLSSSGLDFKSPSTPKGLPELPDPPSSEETESDHTAPIRTPAATIRHLDPKTPRPPGGWATPFATPAPTERIAALPTKLELGTAQDELYTPPASLSKAASLSLKTPAPPGAWLPTPANSKRLQKVRFDEEEASHGPVVQSASPDRNGQLSPTRRDPHSAEKDAATTGSEQVELSSPRTPRRTSTIRIVDAFGKQIVDTPIEKQHTTDTDDRLEGVDPGTPDVSVGTKTRIRVVDSMNIPAEEPSRLDPSVDNPAQENLTSFMEELEGKKLERKQALQLLQKTIADLKNDFTRTDIETESPDPAGTRASDLLTRSHQAREERERLRRELSLATTVEQRVKANEKKSSSVHRIVYRSNGVMFWTLMIIVQFCIFLALCRWSSHRARRLFLTTYMDPYYPELQLHITNPDLLLMAKNPSNHAMPYDTHKNSGWMQSIKLLWHHLSESLSALQDILWETSGDPPRTIPRLPT